MKNSYPQFTIKSPRHSVQAAVFFLFCLWQSIAVLVGLVLFFVLTRILKVAWWVVGLLGCSFAVVALYFELHAQSASTVWDIFLNGFALNFNFWITLFTEGIQSAFYILDTAGFNYFVGLPLLFATVFSVLDLMSNSPHEYSLRALHRGQEEGQSEFPEKKLKQRLLKLKDSEPQGTVLGLSKVTGKKVVISDVQVNQVILVLGTTGGGKTVTLERFFRHAITQGYPLIIVDGKPTELNVVGVKNWAEQAGRSFYGFNCGNYYSYNPFAQGGHTELKDKIICLKEEWASEYYRSIAEDYLQTTFEILLKINESFDLKTVVECLSFEELALKVRATGDNDLMEKVQRLQHYDQKDITGLQAHLNLLLHSELGSYFEINQSSFSLSDVIQCSAVSYFALPALRFPGFAKVLGKLVINDIKAVIDRYNTHKRIFIVFDEFSIFAGEQVLNLINMGRGKGAHTLLGTQGIADLQQISPTFSSQVLNCANTLICHRLNDPESAEAVAVWAGTYDRFDVTAQINAEEGATGMGSVKRNKEFIIHPDNIKQSLLPGEAFYITKVGGFRQDKIKVKQSTH